MRKAMTTAAMLGVASLCGIATYPTGAAAQRVVPKEGMVYSTHSPAVDQCPELFWHVWVGPKKTLRGTVDRGDNVNIWRLKGTYTPDHTFHLDSQELGGAQRTGAVDGRVLENGSLVMTLGNISGPSACEGKSIYVPWFRDGNDFNPFDQGGG